MTASRRRLQRPPTTRRFHGFFHGFFEYQRTPHVWMHELLREYGDFMLWRSLRDVYLVNNPEFLRPVLSQSYEHFSKKTLGYRVLAQIMGNGLITNDGPDWVRQRRLVQPSFSHRTVQGFDRTINALAASMLDEWDRRAGDDRIWLDREMSKLTFRIVGATLFGRNIEGYADEVREISEITNLQPFEPRALMTLYSWLPTPYNRKFKRARKRLDSVVYGILATRSRAGDGTGDILDRLIQARDEDSSEGMDDRQLRDEVVTLMLAGHETSATALSWTLYLLATHPEIEAELVHHLASGLGGASLTGQNLSHVPYLKQVVQEAMRLYPPVWAFARRAEHEEVFDGYLLPARAYVAIIPYALHRHPEFWPDAERFDPERFHPERSKNRHFFSYLPFGAGPRTCIGAGMAMLEIQLVLAQILQRFRVRVAPDHPIEAAAKVTLKPRYGIPVTLSRR